MLYFDLKLSFNFDESTRMKSNKNWENKDIDRQIWNQFITILEMIKELKEEINKMKQATQKGNSSLGGPQ